MTNHRPSRRLFLLLLLAATTTTSDAADAARRSSVLVPSSRVSGITRQRRRSSVHHVAAVRDIPRGGAAVASPEPRIAIPLNQEGASIPNEVFNLVKAIVGAGVLGLPAGIAAFGNAPSALLPALALVAAVSLLSSYGFFLIGRVCAYTGAVSYRDAWNKTAGPRASWVPALCCLLVTACSVLAYSMILADTVPQLMASVGVQVGRTPALLGVTCTVLLPLCLLKELQSLAPFSLVGICGMLYTTAAMAARYLGGQYREGGALLESLAPQYRPSFGTKGASAFFHPNSFILVSMLSTASMSHYLAPKFYRDLKNNTIARFRTVVATSFLVATLIFAAVASVGFLTFGASCSGLVLNNYSPGDGLMSASRVAVAASLLTSYPLAFAGLRDGALELAGVAVNPPSQRDGGGTVPIKNAATVALLAAITALAFAVRDLKLLLSFGGATWGNAVIYLFPTYMFVQCAKTRPELRSEVPVAITTGIIGLGMGAVGTLRALQS